MPGSCKDLQGGIPCPPAEKEGSFAALGFFQKMSETLRKVETMVAPADESKREYIAFQKWWFNWT